MASDIINVLSGTIARANDHSHTIATNTMSGLNLRVREINAIKILFGFTADEEIVLLYKFGGGFEKPFDPINERITGLTNAHIFQIEKGITTSAKFCDIVKCRHAPANIIRWDHIIVELRDGREMDFSVYSRDVAKHFTAFVCSKITK